MHVLLSSGSPRRKELLSLLGIDFEIRVPRIPEVQKPGETPEGFCSRISCEKAKGVSREYPDSLIIGADTIVVIDGRILGKPRDADEAKDFLILLQGREHEVLTGYTVLSGPKCRTNVVATKVFFREMSPGEISWYISTGEPMDKAGAYALQGIGSIFIDRIHGSYTNVIGLPLSHLYFDLKEYGLRVGPPAEEVFHG
jgi:septum formation protein